VFALLALRIGRVVSGYGGRFGWRRREAEQRQAQHPAEQCTVAQA
jgi:hypothetical protein